MVAGRTTLSFLDLSLMLLSVFAYAHFVNLADPEVRKKLAAETVKVPTVLGNYEYKVTDFFDDSSAMLSQYAHAEIVKIPNVGKKQALTIYVPPVAQIPGGHRLLQWETVAARSAAIANAFERAGQDGEMIVMKMPDKLHSKASAKQNIVLTFMPPHSRPINK